MNLHAPAEQKSNASSIRMEIHLFRTTHLCWLQIHLLCLWNKRHHSAIKKTSVTGLYTKHLRRSRNDRDVLPNPYIIFQRTGLVLVFL